MSFSLLSIKITPFNFGINALSSGSPAERVPSPPLAQQYLLTGLNVAPVQLLSDAHIDIHSSLVSAAPSFMPCVPHHVRPGISANSFPREYVGSKLVV